MLGADTMPRSHDAALQERECRFDGVRVNIAHDVDLATMIDGFVLAFVDTRFNHRFRVSDPIIGENDIHVIADVLTNELGIEPLTIGAATIAISAGGST